MSEYTPITLSMSEDEIIAAEVLTTIIDNTVSMNPIRSRFVASRVLKATQIERYQNAGAPKEIMHFINRGSGMGTECEHYARVFFPSLGKRHEGDTKKKSGYDQIHKPSGYKVEQKSGGNWGPEDRSWKWQHIEPNHPWKFLLFCGISYKDIHWFFLSRIRFDELCEKKVITPQGDQDRNSYQGWWFSYKDAKNDLIEIRSNEQLDKLVNEL